MASTLTLSPRGGVISDPGAPRSDAAPWRGRHQLTRIHKVVIIVEVVHRPECFPRGRRRVRGGLGVGLTVAQIVLDACEERRKVTRRHVPRDAPCPAPAGHAFAEGA